MLASSSAQQRSGGEQRERDEMYAVANVRRCDRPADERNGKGEKFHGLEIYRMQGINAEETEIPSASPSILPYAIIAAR